MRRPETPPDIRAEALQPGAFVLGAFAAQQLELVIVAFRRDQLAVADADLQAGEMFAVDELL
jgi:hypothetical protein